MHDFRRLEAWQLSHRLVLGVYEATRSFPTDERFGLTAQLRRAAVSIPSNIAEGAGRRSRADFARFISMACGSANEVIYQINLAHDLGYLTPEKASSLEEMALSVRRIANRFWESLQD